MKSNADFLFETSWEVCNKVGGIYTVLKSKSSQMIKEYGKKYFMIGPYFIKNAASQFIEESPPKDFKDIVKELREEGIELHYGKWIVEDKPSTFLIDFSKYTANNNSIKKELWESFRIDSLDSNYFDFDEPVIWAYTVGKFLEKVGKKFKNEKVVAHFHEWLSGAGLLYLKRNNSKVCTVFTTHATSLGRTISNSNINLYSILKDLNSDEKSYEFNVQSKHLLEKQSATNANVFTTVSEITGIESEVILGRKPDILLPNGLDMKKFPTFEEISISHKKLKSRIQEFLMYYFFPHYYFDLENTLIFFIAGRYEFYDKGIDVLIKSLSNLNKKLKNEKNSKNVVVFFWVPGNVQSVRSDLIENKTLFNDIDISLSEEIVDIKTKLLNSFLARKEISLKNLFDKKFLTELERKILRMEKRDSYPKLSTHRLHNEDTDTILNALKEFELTNKKEDKVKIIFYPIYLTGADGLLNTNYYESMQGSHLGIFPSVYEPWGYTPLECGALGVSSITTDLAGFGRYLQEEHKNKNKGIYVLKRMDKSEEEIVNNLTSFMHKFTKLNKNSRIDNKIAARELASNADWNHFIKYYIEAHNLAIKNGNP